MVENKRLSIEEMHELIDDARLNVVLYEADHGDGSARKMVNGKSVMNGTVIINEREDRVLLGMVLMTAKEGTTWEVLADGKLMELDEFGGSMCDDSALFMLDWMLWVALVPKKLCVMPWGQVFYAEGVEA